ncbi:hypothetical protein ABEB36_005984 [Hypothenemus hampei]|uniref:Uncharacterized protein n=1 Tax=Hypothenemus hampei TaxID=57062 RepID=A0ABD1F1B3_HYPHA
MHADWKMGRTVFATTISCGYFRRHVFATIPDTVEKPSWLNDTDYELDHRPTASDKSGRTYFATRTLPHGQGAFAYVGVSLTGDDWISPLAAKDSSMQRYAAVNQQLSRKYNEEVPQYEMEKILAKRKNPEERQKVLIFYDTLLQIVADELNGKAPEYNETVEGLLEQLIEDLKAKGQYSCCYDNLDDYDKRMELLMTLFDRIKIRRDKVARREEILDDIEQKIIPHIFDVSTIEPDDEYQLPAAMWQQAIEKMPSRKQMDSLKQKYPIPVVERFIIYIAAFKEEIAERIHRTHEKIVTQMKKELRKEASKKKKEVEKIEATCLDIEEVFIAVTEQWKKKQEAEAQNSSQLNISVDDHTRLYENLKATALDAQKFVEEEAARGKFLAEQINIFAEQSKTIKDVHDDSIRKCEQANAKILKNIKRLNHMIKLHETRISDIKHMGNTTKKNVQSIVHGDMD